MLRPRTEDSLPIACSTMLLPRNLNTFLRPRSVSILSGLPNNATLLSELRKSHTSRIKFSASSSVLQTTTMKRLGEKIIAQYSISFITIVLPWPRGRLTANLWTPDIAIRAVVSSWKMLQKIAGNAAMQVRGSRVAARSSRLVRTLSFCSSRLTCTS